MNALIRTFSDANIYWRKDYWNNIGSLVIYQIPIFNSFN